MPTTKVKIFDKTYNSYDEENAVSWHDYLPDFFATKQHFSAKEYYDYVIKNHPEYKSIFKPSEKQIQKMIIDKLGYATLDGATSVLSLKKKYGIDIGEKYIYPKNMTDIEYNAYLLDTLGITPLNNNITVQSKFDAYYEAWQHLHYDKTKHLEKLQSLYQELVSLNPKLKTININLNDYKKIRQLIAGATYQFPLEDISLFINATPEEKNKAKENTKLLRKKYNIEIGWVLSESTIKKIESQIKSHDLQQAITKIQAKQNNKQNLTQTLIQGKTFNKL
ncbi:MAG: hypothetical protein ACLRFI_02455 [Alphaproteobacteria bacterium]